MGQNKLFPDKPGSENPDNTKLLQLLDIYWKEDGKGDSYANVVKELLNGDSYLIFATKDAPVTAPDKWTVVEKETALKLGSLFDVDGTKVLGVFTDERALYSWAKSPTQYLAMSSQDVLQFAQYNGVDRIVVNSGLPNMFVLERARGEARGEKLEAGTAVTIGPVDRPLSQSIAQKLRENFGKTKSVHEVYQYLQTKGGESSIVLGIGLGDRSEGSKRAAVKAVEDAIQGQILEQPLDLYFLEDVDWYDRIAKIENSLLYKK